jgi:predicted esterase
MDGGRGRAVLFLPRTGAAVHWVAGHCDVDSSDIDPLISQAVNLVQVAFHPSVFSGTSFPRCGFDPSPASAALGDCEMTTTFYDRDYNLVTSADKPGRYGAIVEVRTPAGTVFKRFLTLYRTPQPVTWRVTHGYAAPETFPPELGIDPRVVSDREREVAAFETAEIAAGVDHSNDAAILLAGLSETKPGSAPPRNRNAPRTLDQQWWFGLKKKTQDLGIDYSAHLPSDYGSSATKNWPLILFLHGSGERGYDIQAVKNNSLPRRVAAQPDFPAILIAPQCPPGQVWSPFELNALLDRVEKTYRIDPARVYLTGLSMGGYGTWALAAESPQRFAAIVPICGGGDPWDADRIKNIPCWIFHGGKDPAVPLQFSQDMADALKRAGAKNLKFTIYPEAGHDSWTQAYAEPGLFDWMLKQHLPEK